MPDRKQLESITIHCFRGLKDLELSALGRVNLLVGPNNSGKTSVLEAISVYSAPTDVLQWVKVARNRQVGPSFLRFAVEDMKWLFPQGDPERNTWPFQGQVRISSTGDYEIKEVRAGFLEILGSRGPGDEEPVAGDEAAEEPSDDGTGGLRPGASVEVDARTAVETYRSDFVLWEGKRVVGRRLGPSLPVQTITQLSHWIEGLLVNRLSEAELGRTKDQAIELAQGLDTDIRDLKVLSPRGAKSSLYVEHARLGLAPITALGDGVRRALIFALSLPFAKDGVLLIDEIETAIHVEALAGIFFWLVEACRDFNVQLFATTHSLEAVDAMLAEDSVAFGDTVLYRLHAAPDKTAAKRFERDRLARIRYEWGLDVR